MELPFLYEGRCSVCGTENGRVEYPPEVPLLNMPCTNCGANVVLLVYSNEPPIPGPGLAKDDTVKKDTL